MWHMRFGFEKNRMDRTPEGLAAQNQLRERRETRTLVELADDYTQQANEILSGSDATSVRDEIARFAKKISASEGTDQYEALGRLVHALSLRKPGVFEIVPSDQHERAAFAMALVRSYQKALQ